MRGSDEYFAARSQNDRPNHWWHDMDEEAMKQKLSIDDVVPRFLAMSAAQRQLFLATYAHEITILSRGHFVEKKVDSARMCNETLHRIVAYMGTLLRKQDVPIESDFIEMLVADAAQKGWAGILLQSVEMSL